MIKQNSLAIQIVQHNNIEYIKNCLNSILVSSLDDFNVDIFVLDNKTTDGSLKFVKENYPMVKLIESDSSHGFVWNHNYIFNKTKNYDYILVLNNDTVLAKDTISKLIVAMQNDRTLAIVGPQLYYKDGQKQASGANLSYIGHVYTVLHLRKLFSISFKNKIRYLHSILKKTKTNIEQQNVINVEIVSGASMLIRGNVLRRIGGFDNNIYMYGEDTELCYRALTLGYKNAIVRDSSVIHIHSPEYKIETRLHIIKGLFYLLKKYNFNKCYYYSLVLLLYIKYFPKIFNSMNRKLVKEIIKTPINVQNIKEFNSVNL